MDIENIETDIKRLGLPTLMIKKQGFFLRIKPDDYNMDKENLYFLQKNNPICTISLTEFNLSEKRRPSNILGDFKLCYSLENEDEHICYLVWF